MKRNVLFLVLLTFNLHITMLLALRNNSRSKIEETRQRHNDLKELIHEEMLNVPKALGDKSKLKQIWFAGGNRAKIEKIISNEKILSKQELLDLKTLISNEKQILKNKIEKIATGVNKWAHKNLSEELKFKKSQDEIESMIKNTALSTEELIKRELRMYDSIISNLISEINESYPVKKRF